MPRILYTFFDAYDFSGKTIAPFATSGGSGLSGTPGTIAELEPGATVLDGLHVSDFAAGSSESSVSQWLADIGQAADIEDGFILITGGTFRMGSPDTENWRRRIPSSHGG